ncbi:hypothetical protein ACFC1R_34850 [Kitasatospora sp. NPDC056138]|uniref:hypothetical protein n=1 Tax=Kitasatospora sp. NPDC056138 TaxID=3345724 RepID=UPI0035E2A5AE
MAADRLVGYSAFAAGVIATVLLLAATVFGVGLILWGRSVTAAKAGDCLNHAGSYWNRDTSCSVLLPGAENYKVLYTTDADLPDGDCPNRSPQWFNGLDIQVNGLEQDGESVSVCLRPLQ